MERELFDLMPQTRWPAPEGFPAKLCMGGGKTYDPSKDKDREGLDDELDEGLDDTFPASDPVSVSQTTTTGAPGEFSKKGEKEAEDD